MPTLDVAINALRAKHGAKQFDQAAEKIKRAGKKVDKSVDRTQKKLGFLGDKYKSVAKAAIGMAVTYGVIRFLKSSIKEMALYEVGLANVSTMLDETSMKYMPKYGRELDKMAIKYGEATGTLSKGLYDILSASIDAAEALDVLDVAARAATAGLTDTGKAADILTTIINAYGMSASQAEEISDILFATVKRGKTTFDELASSMGMIVSLAATAGLSIEQVGAALATMTRAGISTDMAVTSLKGILTGFLSPTEQSIIAAKKLSLELNSTTLSTIGLTGVIRKLSGATAEQIAAIFTNVRALTGIAALLQLSTGFMYDLGETTDATGKMMEAFGKQIDTTQYKLDQFGEKWKSTKRIFGKEVKPALTPALWLLNKVMEDTVEFIDGVKIAFKTIELPIIDAASALLDLTAKVTSIIPGLEHLSTNLDSGSKATANYVDKLLGLDVILDNVDQALAQADVALVEFNQVMEDYENGVERATKETKDFADALEEGGKAAKKTAEELKALEEIRLDILFKSFEEGMKGDLYAADDLSRGLLALKQTANELAKELEEFVPPSEEYLAALEKMTDATNKIRTEIEYFGMTNIEKQLAQFEQLGESLKGEELESFVSQLAKLREEYGKLAELEAEEERIEKDAKAREKDAQERQEYLDDQAEAYRRLYDDIGIKSTASYENKMLLLDKEKERYGTFIEDKALLDQWYAGRKRELDNEMAIVSDDFFAGFGASIDQMNEDMITWGDVGASVAETLKSSTADALISMTSDWNNWESALEGIGTSVAKVMQKMIADMLAYQIITSTLGLFGFGGGGGTFVNPMAVFGAPTGGEKGLVLKNGKITAFGKGDVINRPTIFPMANGMGIMAEKKPEAVMPLARDEQGRLGVRAEGGGAPTIIKMYNVLDESLFEDYLSTGNGERAVVNIMRRNREEITEVTL